MTKKLFQYEPDSLLGRIGPAYDHVTRLSIAALSIQGQAHWLATQDFQIITLLDFDVICGVLPSFAIHEWLEEESDDPSEPPLRDIVGPHMLRYLLDTMQELSLPPGSLAELLARKQKTTGTLSDRAKDLMRVFNSCETTENPTYEVLNRTTKLGTIDVLLDELSEFATEHADFTLFEDVLSKNTPVEDLLMKDPEEQNVAAFRSVRGRLNVERPRRSINNYHDALNVAYAIWIFNKPAKYAAKRRVPILISNTRSVSGLQIESGWLSVPFIEPIPRLFQDPLYLVITQSLLDYANGSYHVVANEAGLLAAQASELRSYYLTVLDTCNALMERGAQPDEISEGDFPNLEWSMLLHKRQVFQDRWRRVFGRPSTSAEFDRVKYLNYLTPNAKETVRKSFRRYLKAEPDISKLEALLKNSSLYHELWKSMHKFASAQEGTVGEFVENILNSSVVANETGRLSEIATGDEIESLSQIDWSLDRDVQVGLHPNLIPSGAVVLIGSLLDSNYSSTRYISITWIHNSTAEDIWKQGIAIVESLSDHDQSQLAINYWAFSPVHRKDGSFPLSAGRAIFDKLYGESSDMDCFKMCTENVTFFADIEALDEIEKQAGLVLRADLWSRKVLDAVAIALNKTSDFKLPVSLYSKSIEDVLARMNIYEMHEKEDL